MSEHNDHEPARPADGYFHFHAAIERAVAHPDCPLPAKYESCVVAVVGQDGIATLQEITYPQPLGCVLRELDHDPDVIAQVQEIKR